MRLTKKTTGLFNKVRIFFGNLKLNRRSYLFGAKTGLSAQRTALTTKTRQIIECSTFFNNLTKKSTMKNFGAKTGVSARTALTTKTRQITM